MKRNNITLALFPAGLSVVRPGDGSTAIELSYDAQEDIPAGKEDLYTEKDGKFVLTGVKGLKTQDDVNRLQTALAKERNEHKATKSNIAGLEHFGSLSEITERLNNYDELQARANGNGKDPVDLEKVVSARLAPLQRKLDEATNQLKEKDQLIDGYKGKETKATIGDAVRKAAKTLKVRDSAIEDAIMYGERVLTIDESGNVVTKENAGVTPFLGAEEWLRDILPNRSHWLEESVGGGSQGGKGGFGGANDPYSHDGWSITEQMKLYKENPEKAKKMAARHGVDVTNPQRPAKKS